MLRSKGYVGAGASLVLALCLSSPAVAQKTLEAVKGRGVLHCGVHPGLAGFGVPDGQGRWTGFDVDFCRSLAAAIFDDPSKVRFTPLSAKDRFTALQSGEIDILSRNSTFTMQRDTAAGFDFPAVSYFDGQTFMVRTRLGVNSVSGLNGATICVAQGSTNELNVADYFRARGMKYEVVSFGTNEEAMKAYESGRCDSLTSDASTLAAQRLALATPDEHVLLPEIISKEPLGPAVRHGDNQWADLVRWTHMAMVNAEELGVTRANVAEARSSDNPEIRRLLGVEGNFGGAIGLTQDWGYRIIRHMGNYGEAFERNLGAGSRLNLRRGQNALWTNGGLQYGIPIR